MSKVYIKIDELNRVVAINSDVFLTDLTDWILIDEGDGDRYSLAQSNYLGTPLWNEDFIYLYKYEDEQVVRRPSEEMLADIADAETFPTEAERIAELEKKNEELQKSYDMLLECILEISQMIYV